MRVLEGALFPSLIIFFIDSSADLFFELRNNHSVDKMLENVTFLKSNINLPFKLLVLSNMQSRN